MASPQNTATLTAPTAETTVIEARVRRLAAEGPWVGYLADIMIAVGAYKDNAIASREERIAGLKKALGACRFTADSSLQADDKEAAR
ncbi:MAG: hypothetical protein NUW01_02320 [Gemmatimonadaceae bacterium]|nr:hypothetical protein [Gemmatimonadaceae bacterium]